MISPCACPTRVFCDRALHVHRRSSSPPSHLYVTRNGFEFSPEAVVTVRRTRPFFPPLGTVVVMPLLFCWSFAGWPGPKETLRKQVAAPELVPVMVMVSPAFPSSGVSQSSVGASPKQDWAFPAVTADANVGPVFFEAGALVRVWAVSFAFFSCLTGSAALVRARLIAARQTASTPIAIVILTPIAACMTGLRSLHRVHRRLIDHRS